MKNYIESTNLSFNFLFKTSCAVPPYYSSRGMLYELLYHFNIYWLLLCFWSIFLILWSNKVHRDMIIIFCITYVNFWQVGRLHISSDSQISITIRSALIFCTSEKYGFALKNLFTHNFLWKTTSSEQICHLIFCLKLAVRCRHITLREICSTSYLMIFLI